MKDQTFAMFPRVAGPMRFSYRMAKRPDAKGDGRWLIKHKEYDR